MESVAKGMPAESIAPTVRAHQAEVAKIDAQLRQPRPARPNLDKLRAALEQRAEQWRSELRAEPHTQVARLLLRRLVGPIQLFDPPADQGAWVDDVFWGAPVKDGLLDGLTPIQVGSSPTGTGLYYQPVFRGEFVLDRRTAA